jgi:hypothetical protein
MYQLKSDTKREGSGQYTKRKRVGRKREDTEEETRKKRK